jgi:hypothetical protein
MRKALFHRSARASLLILGSALSALALATLFATPAFAGVGYTVTIESPYDGDDGIADVASVVAIRAAVTGGVGDAEQAAYHVRTDGGWSSSASAYLPKSGDRRFGTDWDSTGLANGDYELEVRVWGEVPAYDADDPATFASAVVPMRIDNPPPAPAHVTVTGSAGTMRVAWNAVSAADREDFLGYRVWVHDGSGCPGDLASYSQAASTEETSFGTAGVEPGAYCVRVTAVRRSAVSGEIASALSAPARIRFGEEGRATVAGGGKAGSTGVAGSGGGGGYSTGSTSAGAPPPPPDLYGGEVIVADGKYGEELPYDRRTITQLAEEAAAELEADGGELGPSPRTGPMAVAAGLFMAVAALHLRSFLRRRPETETA